jgi:hypothetical protein
VRLPKLPLEWAGRYSSRHGVDLSKPKALAIGSEQVVFAVLEKPLHKYLSLALRVRQLVEDVEIPGTE